ncbi:hypothetical protein [Streptomyces sp. SID13031]|uniref:hypothetical protein n=1 Tax=Streptomyces sp. SID13031 TaxID=2706046 RepID=UPI0013C87823|nr:hypothetical protein [Streptomyces sp. SID13031]NEA31071.1 hypothetical protein [Streptomyces sp. SID13031]
MSDHTPTENEQDPGASTQMFRAFVNEAETEPAQAPKVNGRTLAIAGVVVVVLAIVAAFLVL